MSDAYSKTPLFRKLGIKSGNRLNLINAPDNLMDLLVGMPEDIHLSKRSAASSLDFILIFSTSFKGLANELKRMKPKLKKSGMIWLSWPKGKSTIETDLNRDDIREYVLTQGLVDVKICSIDENWSALKFVHRLKDR